MREIVAHVVEITVATIEKLCGVAQLTELIAHRECAHAVLLLLDNALSGMRWDAKRKSLQTSHGAISASVKAVENKALRHQPVDVWCQSLLVAVARKEVGAQTLYRDQHDIAFFSSLSIRELLRPVGIQACLLAIERFALCCWEHRVELVILQFVVQESPHKVVRAILLDLRDILIVGIQIMRQ